MGAWALAIRLENGVGRGRTGLSGGEEPAGGVAGEVEVTTFLAMGQQSGVLACGSEGQPVGSDKVRTCTRPLTQEILSEDLFCARHGGGRRSKQDR